jgi:Holliday junction resolvase RusA-like endonuclease
VPRFGKPYYGKRYSEWMRAAVLLIPAHYEPIECRVTVDVIFAIQRSKTGKLDTPVGDGDNYEKAIYDMLQKTGVLKDDRQITRGTWRKRFVPYGEQGYTSITIRPDLEEIDV